MIFVPVTSATDALSLQGNRYTFHFRGNVYMYTNMLVEEAVKSGIKRWAIVAPNYEFGHSAAEAFKRLLKAKVPDAVIVTEQRIPRLVSWTAVRSSTQSRKQNPTVSSMFCSARM